MNHIITLREPLNRISNAVDLFEQIRNIDIDHNKEHFIIISLNTQKQIIGTHIIGVGTVCETLIHPRETFQKAILDSAHTIIIAHNHPSECLKPSNEDIEMTNRLISAGRVLDIEIIDHIIFNKTDFYSLCEHKREYNIIWS
jgi:DNA repair protein RadC